MVIPREIREQLDLKPGRKIQVLVRDGVIVMVPVVPVKELKGFLEGVDTDIDREDDRL
mgnify:FL=1